MFKAWPKIPRLENEVYHITEKIDGTNACIIIEQTVPIKLDWAISVIKIYGKYFQIGAQSRTRLITPEQDNYGFAKWVQDNAEQLIIDLGIGYHFGEWWGQNINRNYGLDHKRFSLFNPTKRSSICFNVPHLAESNAIELNKRIEETKSWLILDGSKAAPGFKNPEGLIIYAEKAKSYWKVIFND